MRGETGGNLILGSRRAAVKAGRQTRQYQRAALVLALARRRLPASQFAALLRLHQAVGWQLVTAVSEGRRRTLWETAMRDALDEVECELGAGRLPRAALRRLVHCYAHLLGDDVAPKGG